MKITGEVTFQEIEGGVWGILGDDGEAYRPVEGLPKEVQIPGCRVEAELEPVEVMSFIMWGQSVLLRSVHRL